MKQSHDSSDLIEELKLDIEEFGGDKVVAVWCQEINDTVVYTNYDFIDPDMPIQDSELNPDEYIRKMTMTALLILLEEQNRLI